MYTLIIYWTTDNYFFCPLYIFLFTYFSFYIQPCYENCLPVINLYELVIFEDEIISVYQKSVTGNEFVIFLSEILVISGPVIVVLGLL